MLKYSNLFDQIKIIKYSIYNNSDMIHNSKISKLKDFKYFNMVYSLI